MKSILIGLMVLFGAATQANAQIAPPTGGEVGALLKCFYECKPGPNVQGVGTYQEITTIMLTNQSPDTRLADVYYFDGKEECIAHSIIDLSPVDLDETAVCPTLEAGVLVPPLAGLIEILVTDPLTGLPADGVYAWGKNVLGKFRTDNPEPFEGRVTGIGKYECRVVPAEVRPDEAVATACTAPLEVAAILVEDTDDDDICACDGDLNGDGVVTALDFAIFQGCIGLPPIGACAGADLNCDGVIDAVVDFAIFECQFLTGFPDPACCP